MEETTQEVTATEQTNTDQSSTVSEAPETLLTGDEQATETTETVKTEEAKLPDSYEDFTFPEGMSFDEAMLGKFTETAKELNLTQEGAQGLLDIANEHISSMGQKQSETWEKTRSEWRDTLKEDKDFGGEKMTETLERAKRTLRGFASEDFSKFLGESGMGDNADLIIAFAKIDKALGEDAMVDGKPAGQAKGAAEVLYGN